MALEYLQQTMLSFTGMHLWSMFGSNHKKVFGKLKHARSGGHFEELKLYQKLSPLQSFPCKFSNGFKNKKRRTAAL